MITVKLALNREWVDTVDTDKLSVLAKWALDTGWYCKMDKLVFIDEDGKNVGRGHIEKAIWHLIN
jgi:hypothetical protein